MTDKPIAVRIDGKGRITLPLSTRVRLRLEPGSMLMLREEGDDRLTLAKVADPFGPTEDLREFTDEEIEEFMELDKLDPETQAKVARLLARK